VLLTAIQALGISGTPEAEKILERLLENENSMYDLESDHSNLEDVLETAIRENLMVRTLGLLGYYQRRSGLYEKK
jgi:hypothetical protein